MNALDWFVLAVYASLLVELVVFPIPSEASTWQLLRPEREAGTNGDAAGQLADAALLRAQHRSLPDKLLRFLLPTAFGVVMFVLPLLALIWPPAAIWRVPVSPAAVWLGVALAALGRGITFVSVLQLRAQRRCSGGPPGGLFAWSRNPGLIGMYLCYAGLALACGLPVMWLGFPVYLANMHQRVRLEEARLTERHGADWQRYAARTPRYLARW